MFRRR